MSDCAGEKARGSFAVMIPQMISANRAAARTSSASTGTALLCAFSGLRRSRYSHCRRRRAPDLLDTDSKRRLTLGVVREPTPALITAIHHRPDADSRLFSLTAKSNDERLSNE